MATINTILGSDTITSSRTVINQNFTNLNTDKIETSVLDTDTALAANSDLKVATQKAVKAYIDALGNLTTKTSGVSAGPATSSTQTIGHALGRVPTVIRLAGIGNFTNDANSNTASSSEGTFNTTGNRCIYLAGGTASHNPVSSTVFAVYLDVASGVTTATGVVQNVTTTNFDIVWTVSGSVALAVFLWEAN